MDNILSLREKLEDKKKQEFGAATRKLQIENEKKQSLINESIYCSEDLRNRIKHQIIPEEIISYNQYLQLLKRKTVEQEKRVKKAALYADKKREELLEAVKQRKMLEALKEKRWNEYLEESNREEQKIIDEIVSFKSQSR
ncbi:MAG TPA: flagellar export protein FliJ [Epulopiscium sp.]|jgi:flagellar FliJ protein|nr:flagellar export protein FliJ [Candidatus Epulonipiscium sp.]